MTRPPRICLTGVESTGKSRLAPRLAAHFGGVVMPEYGREWAETNGLDFTPDALREIAVTHVARREALTAAGARLIIEDTDVVMTAAWFAMLHGGRDPVLSALPADADLYLLMSPDTAWIEDGTRQFAGTDRLRFSRAVDAELGARGITPVVIDGSWRAREAAAVAAIQSHLALTPV